MRAIEPVAELATVSVVVELLLAVVQSDSKFAFPSKLLRVLFDPVLPPCLALAEFLQSFRGLRRRHEVRLRDLVARQHLLLALARTVDVYARVVLCLGEIVASTGAESAGKSRKQALVSVFTLAPGATGIRLGAITSQASPRRWRKRASS